ncbi:MAG: Fe-S cluster assembly scaffold protein NifU [Desulfomonile tiedjei]|uniref:Fe-S cluster assembly scaffold protein NifU n=1 Tax=Desulfomonile tiedjei TaxID=2358 RepID=A0A9D6V4W8_9BACT|nr:Fe-S cluster assembly scaffold protein NifU [Desulfomonile tiedjei]
MYSDIVMEHFKNPRNVGEIPDADGVGEVGNPACGDIMAFYIKVNGNILEDVKFKTFGCGAAIAVSSMVSEMAIGKTLEEAMQITNNSVIEALNGLPKKKHHCSNLGADALHRAIEDFRSKQQGRQMEKPVDGPEVCSCPVCDVNDPEEAPYCNTACGHSSPK